MTAPKYPRIKRRQLNHYQLRWLLGARPRVHYVDIDHPFICHRGVCVRGRVTLSKASKAEEASFWDAHKEELWAWWARRFPGVLPPRTPEEAERYYWRRMYRKRHFKGPRRYARSDGTWSP
jgi:hypothetical protein